MFCDIHYYRPGLGATIYHEQLVSDDDRALRTVSVFTEEIALKLSARLRAHGVLAPGQLVGSVRKAYFYAEPFDLLAFYQPDGALAGYYSDLAWPLERRAGEYHITDLFLDVWLAPDGRVFELDWDEFEHAQQAGWLTPADAAQARHGLARLLEEIRRGVYPGNYL